MKNFLALLLAAALFISCKKNTASPVDEDASSLASSTVISTGNIAFSEEGCNQGVAKIYQRKDGVYVLALEQMNYQTVFSDKNIYLSSTPQLTTASIKIFSAKKLQGNIYYAMSSNMNIASLKYLIIQGDADADAVASAILQ